MIEKNLLQKHIKSLAWMWSYFSLGHSLYSYNTGRSSSCWPSHKGNEKKNIAFKSQKTLYL